MPPTWVLYAFVTFLGYFFVNFLFKFVSGENPFLISLILYGVAAIAMFFILLPKMNFTLSYKSIIIAGVIGISSVVGTIFALKAINLAPNPGFAVAIYSSSVILITIMSVFVFGSSFSLIKFFGVLAVFVGIVLLSV